MMRCSRQIEAEYAAAFREQHRFRAVQVLGRVFRAGHHATAEGNHASRFIADSETSRDCGRCRKHLRLCVRGFQPIPPPPKPPAETSALAAIEAACPNYPQQSRSGIFGSRRRYRNHATRDNPESGLARLGFCQQLFRRAAQAAEQASSSCCFWLVFSRETPNFGISNPTIWPSGAEAGVDKLDAIPLHHKIDRVPAGLASKAEKILLDRVHLERRRLLLVKGAQADVILAAPLPPRRSARSTRQSEPQPRTWALKSPPPAVLTAFRPTHGYNSPWGTRILKRLNRHEHWTSAKSAKHYTRAAQGRRPTLIRLSESIVSLLSVNG